MSEERRDEIQLGRGRVDLGRGLVHGPDGPESLSPNELALLLYFVRHPGRVLDRQELLKEVWGYRPGVVSRAVDHAVKRLRIKVERDRRRPEHIVTVTGRGYRFELPPQPPERAPVPSEPEGAPSRGNLTASLDAFVGRTAALDWLSAEASSHTICGIVGPPGGGKSRLAAHWAWSQRQAAPGGVWRISLAGTADLEGLLQGLATLLGFELGPGGPEEAQGQVGERLQGLGRAVLLFDDADLVLSTLGSCMEDWSRGAPELLFLFTAREEPQLAGASVLRLAAMEPTEAVELLRARSGSSPRQAEGESLLRLLAALDHLPLAIELAAPLMDMLSAEALLERWEGRRLRLRRRGSGQRSRHDTLEAALEDSWALLEPWEQAALVQCGAFAGPFPVASAEAVVDLSAWPDRDFVFEVLERLHRKSLISTTELGGVRRLGLSPFIQAFVRDPVRTLSGGERDCAELLEQARARHAAYFARPEPGRPPLGAPDPRLPEMLGACTWASESGDAELAAGALLAASSTLLAFGPLPLLRETAGQVLELAPSPQLEVRVRLVLGRTRYREGDPEGARENYEEALRLARELEEPESTGEALRSLAGVLRAAGRGDEVERTLLEAIAILEPLGASRGLAHVHQELGGFCIDEAAPLRAEEHLRRAVDLFEQLGDGYHAGETWARMANLRKGAGRYAEARVLYEEGLAAMSALGPRRGLARALMNYANMLADLGDTDRALELYRQGLDVAARIGDRVTEGVITGNMGAVLAEVGEYAQARRLFTVACRAHRAHGLLRHRAIVLGAHMRLELHTGQVDAAGDLLEEIEELTRSLNQVRLTVLGRVGRSLWFLQKGQPERAAETLEPCLDLIQQHKIRRLLLYFLYAHGKVAVARGDSAEARRALRELDELLVTHEIGSPSVFALQAEELRAEVEAADAPAG